MSDTDRPQTVVPSTLKPSMSSISILRLLNYTDSPRSARSQDKLVSDVAYMVIKDMLGGD